MGVVTLVGGGPGDPGLVTVAGRDAIAAADVILTDRLVPQAALAWARPDAEIIDVAKVPGGRSTDQDEINRLLIEHAKAGNDVVRFKGGDSFVFGRGGEELLACADAGIEARVIPGVSSAIAVPAIAGIPVTHRGLTQAFTVVSGHVPPGHPDSTVDWAALARAGIHDRRADGRAHPRRDHRRSRRRRPRPRHPGGRGRRRHPAQPAGRPRRRRRASRRPQHEPASAPPAVTVIGDVAALDLRHARRVIFWVRHGQSTWNAIDRMQGHELSPPLTDLGRAQSVQAADALVDRGVHHLLSSPATRALETATIIGDRLGLGVVIEPLLLEKGLDEDVVEVHGAGAEAARARTSLTTPSR